MDLEEPLTYTTLFKLSINHEGKEYIIEVHEGDDLHEVARKFARRHDLTYDAMNDVVNALVETQKSIDK